MSDEILVVAAEASGDRIAALAARALAARGHAVYGAGGPACRAAGVSLFADTESLGAMGVTDVLRRIPLLASVLARLADRVRRSPPRAALLVNATELSRRLAPLLRALGVRVLWCVAPQVWAWRPGRLHALRGAIDRLAVILPFEEPLWRDAGVDAHYVGHPSLDVPAPPRGEMRARLGIADGATAIAVLPGSRPGEVRRLADPLAQAAARLAGEGHSAAMILAPGLPAEAQALARGAAARARLPVVMGDPDHGAAPLLPAFDLTLTASGTASLEAALAGAAPVVAYRLDAPSYALARLLVRTPHIALPNVLLGRRAYPELVQDEVTPAALAAAGKSLLLQRSSREALPGELRALLRPPSATAAAPFGERLARLMDPWLVGASAAHPAPVEIVPASNACGAAGNPEGFEDP
ncbi:MAG: lipid-A-disaccharide synthase [Byssovorax sp.]